MASTLGKSLRGDLIILPDDGQPFVLFEEAAAVSESSSVSAQSDSSAPSMGLGAPPVVVINDHSVPVNHWTQIQSWVSYFDQEHDQAVYFQFLDLGSAVGAQFWTPSGGYQPYNATLTVTASDLANVWIGGATSAGTETMAVRAFDGTGWSTWGTFNFTAIANTAPVVTATDGSLAIGNWTQVQNWLSYSDANSDLAIYYQFMDTGAGAGSGQFWTQSGGFQTANTTLTVGANDISTVWIGGATVAGTETMLVRAFDGTDWSGWESFDFTARPNAVPTATLSDIGIPTPYNTWARITAFDLTYSDADGEPAVYYQFIDEGNVSGGGKMWSQAAGYLEAGTVLTVVAADISNVYVGGITTPNQPEHMAVRAYDGHNWSNWDPFNVTGYDPM